MIGISRATMLQPARLRHRFLSLIYESMLLAAIVMATTLPVVMLTTSWSATDVRLVLQAILITTCGAYFVWQWTQSGQTLAMKTWRIRLVAMNGDTLTPARATARYLLALMGLLACGVGYLWAFVDFERKFLHDRIAGSTIVYTER